MVCPRCCCCCCCCCFYQCISTILITSYGETEESYRRMQRLGFRLRDQMLKVSECIALIMYKTRRYWTIKSFITILFTSISTRDLSIMIFSYYILSLQIYRISSLSQHEKRLIRPCEHRLRTYNNCFDAHEFVDFLVSTQGVQRLETVHMCALGPMRDRETIERCPHHWWWLWGEGWGRQNIIFLFLFICSFLLLLLLSFLFFFFLSFFLPSFFPLLFPLCFFLFFPFLFFFSLSFACVYVLLSHSFNQFVL